MDTVTILEVVANPRCKHTWYFVHIATQMIFTAQVILFTTTQVKLFWNKSR